MHALKFVSFDMCTAAITRYIFFLLIFLSDTLSLHLDLWPSKYVTTAGSGVSFICTPSNGNVSNIQWFVNGTEIFSSQENVMDNSVSLLFSNLSEVYNMSKIQCKDGEIASNVSLLFIQGLSTL